MIQLFHSVLSRVLWASSQFILCPSRDVDATAEDQNVSGACRGEVGWADLASAMAVQLLLRAWALVVIQSLPRRKPSQARVRFARDEAGTGMPPSPCSQHCVSVCSHVELRLTWSLQVYVFRGQIPSSCHG